MHIVELLLRRVERSDTIVQGPHGSIVGNRYLCIVHLPLAYGHQPDTYGESQVEAIAETVPGKNPKRNFKGNLYLAIPRGMARNQIAKTMRLKRWLSDCSSFCPRRSSLNGTATS